MDGGLSARRCSERRVARQAGHYALRQREFAARPLQSHRILDLHAGTVTALVVFRAMVADIGWRSLH
jgi:hypothetical protein